MLRITLAALAALALSAGTGRAQTAQPKSVFDVDAPTMTLGFDGQSDTELARGFHGGYRGGFGGYRGGYYGGYRGYYGGYRGYYGYGRGYYGGYYRPYYGYGYYRPYYSYGYYRPYYGYGYGGYGYGYGYPSYYYAQPYYYGGYYGCSSNGSADLVQAVPLNQLPSIPQVTSPNMPYAPNGNGNGNSNGNGGNFNYDGGPNNPVPLPSTNPQTPQYNPPAPQVNPQTPAIPTKGYLVSLPGSTSNSGYTYQAYGSQPTTPRTTTPARTNFAFPAYGETQKSSSFASGN
jgi:hypothetical protein